MKSNLFHHQVKSVFIAETLDYIGEYAIDDPASPWIGDDIIVIVKDKCKDPIGKLKETYKKELEGGIFDYQELIELTKIWLRVIG